MAPKRQVKVAAKASGAQPPTTVVAPVTPLPFKDGTNEAGVVTEASTSMGVVESNNDKTNNNKVKGSQCFPTPLKSGSVTIGEDAIGLMPRPCMEIGDQSVVATDKCTRTPSSHTGQPMDGRHAEGVEITDYNVADHNGMSTLRAGQPMDGRRIEAPGTPELEKLIAAGVDTEASTSAVNDPMGDPLGLINSTPSKAAQLGELWDADEAMPHEDTLQKKGRLQEEKADTGTPNGIYVDPPSTSVDRTDTDSTASDATCASTVDHGENANSIVSTAGPADQYIDAHGIRRSKGWSKADAEAFMDERSDDQLNMDLREATALLERRELTSQFTLRALNVALERSRRQNSQSGLERARGRWQTAKRTYEEMQLWYEDTHTIIRGERTCRKLRDEKSLVRLDIALHAADELMCGWAKLQPAELDLVTAQIKSRLNGADYMEERRKRNEIHARHTKYETLLQAMEDAKDAFERLQLNALGQEDVLVAQKNHDNASEFADRGRSDVSRLRVECARRREERAAQLTPEQRSRIASNREAALIRKQKRSSLHGEQTTLTQEQRERIAASRECALAKKRKHTQHTSEADSQ